MNNESPLYWSFPIGTWFTTRVRMSVFFPPLLVALMVWMREPLSALIVGTTLFVIVLLHEFAHVFAARMTGGYGEDILIWPFGGLASVQPGYTLNSRLLTPAAGPMVHLALCLLLVAPMYQLGSLSTVINPLAWSSLPNAIGGATPFEKFCTFAFVLNWAMFLINLLPVFPLDGGRILQVLLTQKLGNETGTEAYIRIGTVVGMVIMCGGLIFWSAGAVFLGAIILLLNQQESIRLRTADSFDESFMGYDFSQGYTSLERSAEERPARKGLFRRWKEQRAEEKRRREREAEAEEERELDRLLGKVHSEGPDSLTDAEKSLLKRASARYRDRNSS